MFVDYQSDYCVSKFVRKKNELEDEGLNFFKKLRATSIQVKTLRLDNAGENKKLQRALEEEEFNIDFQYTAAGTPQQNGRVERKFATLYGKVRSTLNSARITKGLRCKLWAECASHVTDIENIIVKKADEKSAFEKFYGTTPRYAKDIRVFGEMGIVRNYEKKIKAKLENRGIPCMFVGYSKDHEDDVYRMLNVSTLKIKNTRDVIWLNKSYGEWKGIKGHSSSEFELAKESSSDTDSTQSSKPKENRIAEKKDSSSNDSSSGDEKSEDSSYIADRTRSKLSQQAEDDLAGELNRMRITETAALTMSDIAEWCLVGGEDANYVNPATFDEAWNHPIEKERQEWRDAIRKEINDMTNREVWRKTKKNQIPSNRRLIGSKWVFKKKGNGVYRARLCGLGYVQVPGLDYTENFSPVVLEVTFRIVLILMIKYGWVGEIIDVETAFLYGELEEEIYLKIPAGLDLVTGEKFEQEDCLVLLKAMYGLVQAARQFYKKLVRVTVEKMGFKKSDANGCLLMRVIELGTVILCVYVDDMLVVGDKTAVEDFKQEIKKHFNTKEEGTLDEYVGCKVVRKGDELHMFQPDIMYKLEKEFGADVREIRKYRTPASPGFAVRRPTADESLISAVMQKRFRMAVGLMLFLVKFSRPDISNSVRELAKVNDGATNENFKQMLRAVRFVLDTRKKVLRFKPKINKQNDEIWDVYGYCDSDFAGDKDSRLSVSGFCVFVMGCLVSWKSRGQKNVTLSSTEAEYVAISELCAELLFVRMILTFLGKKIDYPIIVRCDNIGAIFLAHNTKTSHRTKHIDTCYHFVREYVEDNVLKIVFVKSADNQADPFTKNVGEEGFKKNADVYQE